MLQLYKLWRYVQYDDYVQCYGDVFDVRQLAMDMFMLVTTDWQSSEKGNMSASFHFLTFIP